MSTAHDASTPSATSARIVVLRRIEFEPFTGREVEVVEEILGLDPEHFECITCERVLPISESANADQPHEVCLDCVDELAEDLEPTYRREIA